MQEIEGEPEYRAMERLGANAQRDVFDKIVDELRKQFRDDKRTIELLCAEAGLIVVPETTQAEFEVCACACISECICDVFTCVSIVHVLCMHRFQLSCEARIFFVPAVFTVLL
jgi:hypothetical protein